MPCQTKVRCAVSMCLLVALALSACVAAPPLTPTPPSPTAAPPTPAPDSWLKVKVAGRILVGTSADYPPFEYYNERRRIDGFDVALIQEIAENLGLRVEIKDFAFDGLSGALQLGQIDLAISAITFTPQRAAQVDFSNPYFEGQGAALAGPRSNITAVKAPRDMAGKKIGVQTGTLYQTWAKNNLVNPGLIKPRDLMVYVDNDQAVNDLQRGRVDLVLLDAAPAQTYADQGGMQVVGETATHEPYAIAVRLGSTEFVKNLNNALADLQASGRIVELARQYGLLADAVSPPPAPVPTPAPPVASPTPVAPTACIDGAKWVQDLNYDDQNMTAPPPVPAGQPFQKGWQMSNSGTCTWDSNYKLAFVQGEPMGGQPVAVAGPVAPGKLYDFYVNLVAPNVPGVYQGFWQMVNGQGVAFGERVYVGITVPSTQPTPAPTQTPATGIYFAASPTQITAGQPVVFTWDVTNAKAVYFYQEGQPWESNGVAGKDSRTVYPQYTSNYYLRVVRPDNTVETRTITIYVQPAVGAPVINRFTIAPEGQAPAGACIQIDWNVQGNVQRVNIARNDVSLWDNAPIIGNLQDCPPGTGTLTYSIEATGQGGTSRAAKYVTLNAAPTAAPPPTAVPPTAVPPTPVPPSAVPPTPVPPTAVPPTPVPPTPVPPTPVPSTPVPPTAVPPTPVPPMIGRSWSLTSYNNGQGALVSTLAGTSISALFSADGRLSGTAGCNQYSATYTVNGSQISIGLPVGGQMMCEQPVIEQEQAYLSLLPQAASYQVNGNQLVINNAGGTRILTYVAP